MRIEFNGNTYNCFAFFVVYLKRNKHCFQTSAQVMFNGYQAALNWIQRHEHDADKFIVQVYALTNTRECELVYLCDLGGEKAAMTIPGGLISPRHDTMRVSYRYAVSILAPYNLDLYYKDKSIVKRRLNNRKALDRQIAYYKRKICKPIATYATYLDEMHDINRKLQREINTLREIEQSE